MSQSHVTSRGHALPTSQAEMDHSVWFNLWRKQLWPYRELQAGDDLYWYESPTKRIVWHTRIVQLEAFDYDDIVLALDEIDAAFEIELDRDQAYLEDKPYEGYCLAYEVETIRQLDLPRPPQVPKFNRMGWERGDRPEIAAWIAQAGTP